MLPSPEVLRILKATEVIFKRRVINTEQGITVDRMIDLKIESAVAQQIGIQCSIMLMDIILSMK